MSLLGDGDVNTTRKAIRVASVNVMWRIAIETVYKDAANLVLDHVNAVYIMSADDVDDARAAARVTNGGTVLVVYSDDSLIRSDLDARQEFIKMKLNEQGEHVEVFCIKPSRFDMKARHPFSHDQTGKSHESGELVQALYPPAPRPLTQEQMETIRKNVESVENKEVKQALVNAMVADMQRKQS